MSSQTPTARLVKIIRRNETVSVSNVIKHNGEFTKSPPETLNYLLDILSPGSQQTENHATRGHMTEISSFALITSFFLRGANERNTR